MELTTSNKTQKQPIQILREYFGYTTFRPLQKEIIQAVLNQQDCLVLMPTGGGKSICFQIPAMVMEGLCIVVSPLISLMKDQVQSLKQNGVPAAYINSSQTPHEQQFIEKECYKGNIKLLYISPEKLQTNWFYQFTRSIKINLFAIDEAHCISFWGHDFRKEYNQLSFLKERYPGIPVIALTATADELTRKDIVKQLDLKDAKEFVSSFDRPNLSLEVRPGQKRVQQIFDYLEKHPREAGIIYCLSRKGTESLAEKLQKKGYRAACYHARLDPQTKSHTQEAFLKDDIQIVCATVAFGMGIDKSNVRFVFHYNVPRNIESYYQEIGRAGRDGANSKTILFYSIADILLYRKMLAEEQSDIQELKLSKLERLQQFAEANMCRRRILLNYFGENLEENCGNCDVCRNPRQTFDGTVTAQKAFSAIYRMKQKVSIGTVVDVLRGLHTQRTQHNDFKTIKTFGAGREHKATEWLDYITQLVNQGFLNIAYDQNNALQLKEPSHEVLFKGKKVELVRPSLGNKPQEFIKRKTQSEIIADALFERLRQLRKRLADEQGVPPYVVFNDSSLRQMSQERPTTENELLAIAGVGLKKMAFYGEDFINAILEFLALESQKNPQIGRLKGASAIITYYHFKKGESIPNIAAIRKLKVQTIYSHLGALYEKKDYPIDIHDLLPKADLQTIGDAYKKLPPDNNTAKVVFDALGGKYDYGQIYLGLAYWRKNKK